MLRLFRSISRGRTKDDTKTRGTWSPFTRSPERTRAVARRFPTDDYDDDNDEEEEEEDDDEDELSPRHPLIGRDNDYFGNVNQDEEEYDEDEDEDGPNNENEDGLETPLLPIFSAAHLDRLPLYNVTHAIRQLIVQRCETTLSWDQLRSPQISQFLVKPIQSQIRADHFNRATLCALIANCLQFQKEGQMNPGNVGVSKTRALIAELLAMRLLRELSTRELIDSLSYDFDPLQGITSGNPSGQATPAANSDVQLRKGQGRVARVSTIEIAIRAEAKRFLAHPLVVQHLEAIWSGNIVFHSEADNLHRRHRRSKDGTTSYGTHDAHSPSGLPADSVLSRKARGSRPAKKAPEPPVSRRTVTLYNPRDASLFKLSRLRVPRYRQVFSTLSFATMLALFVAVLAERSLAITPLEVLFWFWSIGYMLDEVVGFTEQGFGLYILSFWNAFDLGILFLFGVYYCLRLYGIVLAEEGKQRIAGIAYDVLAATAILLFPRLFSVLDHYRYFSQLLIAFRMMTVDLMAILVLIVISCSGFWVALSLSFSDTRDANGVAYSLFQILMGFTPAVWDHWNGYNILGKGIMAVFLTICHFLIVTILITVLTNSFMAIVKNAEEEHQFLFAVNTISMVKSDALFSYVAPTNIVGWMLSPIRFLLPLRTYVKLNRTVIKVSHFPILFTIFTYERIIMARSSYGPTDLVEKQPITHAQPVVFSIHKAPDYGTAHRLREPSVISFRKDRALDEVFRRPFQGDTVRTTTKEMDVDRQQDPNAVDQWMQEADMEGGASPPIEQPRSVLERLEHRRPRFQRAKTADRMKMMKRSRDFSTATRSVASDPDLLSITASRRPFRIVEENEPEMSTGTFPQDTEADGDDEINDNDDSDNAAPVLGESAVSIHEQTPGNESEADFFTPIGPDSPLGPLSHAARQRLAYSPEVRRGPATPVPQGQSSVRINRTHNRQTSSGTILFAPAMAQTTTNPQPPRPTPPGTSKKNSGGTATPVDGPIRTRSPNRKPASQQARARPIMPPRQKTLPHVTSGGLTFLDMPTQRSRREPSFNARALDLASDLGDNKFGPGGLDAGGISGMPASFSEQLMRERELQRRAEEDRRRSEDEEKGMVNRIMLARMHTLEEGFREVLKEIKDLSQNATNSSRRDSEVDSGGAAIPASARPKGVRQTLDPQSALGAPGSTKTPIGRIGGNEKDKSRRSPRKAQVPHRSTKKGKENERPNSSGLKTGSSDDVLPEQYRLHQLAREVHHAAGEQIEDNPSPVSVQSVFETGIVGDDRQQHTEAGAASVRPTTAMRDERSE